MTPASAIEVRDACKSHKQKRGQSKTLNHLNLSVEYGTIYGLLGPSGCGKTTLLSSILGINTLDAGTIRVFGHPPGSVENRIPGSGVGYMPQECGLYEFFKIHEILHYYGRIEGMRHTKIEKRIKELTELLHLPKSSMLISTLSGGQLRRVSLAISLIHKPPLLVLDEPTVGIDPLLRHSIWEHLLHLTSDKKTTVIVTTHYVEEARRSDIVGIMRNGAIMAEENPEILISRHKAVTLEEVVLSLCHDQEMKREPEPITPFQMNNGVLNSTNICNAKSMTDGRNNFWDVTSCLVRKKFIRQKRNLLFLGMQMIIPIMFAVTAQTTFGHPPIGQKVAYVIHDQMNLTPDLPILEYCGRNLHLALNASCFGSDVFSYCTFFNGFKPNEIKWQQKSKVDDAMSSVQRGETVGFIEFPSNFSRNVYNRLVQGRFADKDSLDGSQIRVKLDAASVIIYQFVIRTLIKGLQESIRITASFCGEDSVAGEIPLKFGTIYGEYSEYSLTKELQTSGVTAMMFVLTSTPAIFYLMDRNRKLVERDRVAGVKPYHEAMAVLIADSSIAVIQITIFFTVYMVFYDMEIHSSELKALAFVLAFLNALAGLAFGFLVAGCVRYELEICLIGLAVILTNNSCGGFTWPLESVAYWLRIFCYSLPVTLPAAALKSVSLKEWGWDHPQILLGGGISLVWIALCILLLWLITTKPNKVMV